MDEVHKFPGFTDLLKESWRIYTQNFKHFLKLVGVGFLFLMGLILPGSVLLALLFKTHSFILLGISGIVLVLAIIAIQLWIQISVLRLIKLVTDGENAPGIRTLLAQTRPLILPYIALSTISFFLILGGYMLLVIPGIFFSIWFGFGIYVFIDEGKRGMNALLTSKDYIEGFVLRVLIRWVIFAVLIGILSTLPPILLENTIYEWIGSVYSFVITFLTTPLYYIYGYLIYKALKAQKPALVPNLSKQRKMKYVGFSTAGYILAIALVLFIASTLGGR